MSEVWTFEFCTFQLLLRLLFVMNINAHIVGGEHFKVSRNTVIDANLTTNPVRTEYEKLLINPRTVEGANLTTNPLTTEDKNLTTNPLTTEYENLTINPPTTEDKNLTINPLTTEDKNVTTNPHNIIAGGANLTVNPPTVIADRPVTLSCRLGINASQFVSFLTITIETSAGGSSERPRVIADASSGIHNGTVHLEDAALAHRIVVSGKADCNDTKGSFVQLDLSPVSCSDSGTYYCRVQLAAGDSAITSTDTINITVQSNPQKITISIQKPKPNETSNITHVYQDGETITIRCTGRLGTMLQDHLWSWEWSNGFTNSVNRIWQPYPYTENIQDDPSKDTHDCNGERGSTLSHIVRKTDNGRMIRCLVNNNEDYSLNFTVYVNCDGNYGPECNLSCSDRNCKYSNVSCDSQNGSCDGECQAGWQGEQCSKKCDSEHYGESCTSVCADRHCKDSETCQFEHGRCEKGCDTGWSGLTCTGGEECDSMHYGKNCTSLCTDRHCKYDQTCDHRLGYCKLECLPGWSGLNCVEECDSEHFGENCKSVCADRHCLGNQTCHHELGHCQDGCIPGWIGLTCAETGCDSEHYGENCSLACADRHCKEEKSCSDTTGYCLKGCLPGWSGLTCVHTCDSKYFGENCASLCADRHCLDNQTCNHELGHCELGCLPGWTGMTCVEENKSDANKTNVTSEVSNCDSDHYGDHCGLLCADRHCKEDITCDNRIGYCKRGCLSGWSGETCVEECDSDHYGENCTKLCKHRHCKDDRTCDNQFGYCYAGCLPGWTGLACDSTVKNDCDSEHYGVTCEQVCEDRHCEGNQTCDDLLGNCYEGCLAGWSGVNCLYPTELDSEKCLGGSCLPNASDEAELSPKNCKGGKCAVRSAVKQSESTINASIIIGCVVSGVIVISLIAAAGNLLRLRRKRKRKAQSPHAYLVHNEIYEQKTDDELEADDNHFSYIQQSFQNDKISYYNPMFSMDETP